MPQRRRVLVATTSARKIEEIGRELSQYDIECEACPPLPDGGDSQDEAVRRLLRERGEDYWIKAVFRETTRVYAAPLGGLEGFDAASVGADGLPAAPRATMLDGEPVVVFSLLEVFMLPPNEEAEMRERKEMEQKAALHTHPLATGSVTVPPARKPSFLRALRLLGLHAAPPALILAAGAVAGPAAALHALTAAATAALAVRKRRGSAEPPAPAAVASEPRRAAAGGLRVLRYTHAVEGYVDAARRVAVREGVFDWDDSLVLLESGRTYEELRARGMKFSPRDANVARWVIEQIHYKKRKATNWINESATSFSQTVMFDQPHSVAAFVATNRYFNNAVASAAGLSDVFRAVANNGAFFRAATTRREVNYWCPGLNAGIPFVAKRDPIHEITFTAHDFGHFLIPDLVFTGNVSPTARRTYILYRMLSEATTMVFADMLFVETLRLSGEEYDWAKRCIHPLFVATGLTPFGGDRAHFFDEVRTLLEANVEYCLLGSTAKYVALIERARGGEKLPGGTCEALEKFKAKFMPFFVEDYKWTNANFANMARRKDEFARWWRLAQPVVEAAGLSGMKDGIGLETVDEFMAAIGVGDDSSIAPDELIRRCFARVFETRIVPILSRPGAYALADEATCLRNAFARYLVGQLIIFARFDFLAEAKPFHAKLVRLFADGVEAEGGFTHARVATARALYAQFLRVLLRKALITPDDYANYRQICPLFEPVYVFYDEKKEFYQELAEVQRAILAGP